MPSTRFATPLSGSIRSSSLSGADPSRSWAMVEVAIRQLEIELVWLPAGDPALKGALPSSTSRAGPSAARREGMRRSPWSSSPTSSDMRAFTRHRPIARLMTSTRHDRRRRRRSGCSVSRTTAPERRDSKRTSLRESSCCRAPKRAVGTSQNASAPPPWPRACSSRRTWSAAASRRPPAPGRPVI